MLASNGETARGICDILTDEGWVSPNTYSKVFAEIPHRPGIYAILAAKVSPTALHHLVYIGKSKRLANRLRAHTVFKKIRKVLPDCFIQIWFKECPVKQLDLLEAEAIQRLNPSLNVQLRKWCPNV